MDSFNFNAYPELHNHDLSFEQIFNDGVADSDWSGFPHKLVAAGEGQLKLEGQAISPSLALRDDCHTPLKNVFKMDKFEC